VNTLLVQSLPLSICHRHIILYTSIGAGSLIAAGAAITAAAIILERKKHNKGGDGGGKPKANPKAAGEGKVLYCHINVL
jgi:hypothetical protein